MDKQSIISSGVLELYALGIASEEEQSLVENLMSTHPEVREEVNLIQSALNNYAAQQIANPPAGMKEAIMRSINNADAPTPKPQASKATSSGGGNKWIGYTGWAAALLLGGLSLFFFNQKNDSASQLSKSKAAFTTLEADCQTQKAKNQLMANYNDFLIKPTTRHIHVFNLETKAPQVVVYWNSESKAGYINTFDLPAPPKDKTYQMWADVEGEMINMGTFNCQPNELQKVEYIANAESINITLEPLGGSDHPTVSLLQANGKV